MGNRTNQTSSQGTISKHYLAYKLEHRKQTRSNPEYERTTKALPPLHHALRYSPYKRYNVIAELRYKQRRNPDNFGNPDNCVVFIVCDTRGEHFAHLCELLAGKLGSS